MAVAKRLGRLGWISLHKNCIRMRQAHYEEVNFAFHPADHPEGLAKINLRVALPMRQWHEHFFGAPLLFAHVIGHRRQAARISMLISQTFKNALGRVTLLFDQRFIGAQNLVDGTNISIKRWTSWRF